MLHADGTWTTDYPKALQQASKEKKEVLLDFTGSDWCIWCQKLQKDVFSQPLFQEFAKNNLILVEIDFPQGKEQSDDLKKQNESLQKQYSVEGFPTLILLDPKGNVIKKSSGYLQGGPEAFIAWVGNVKEKQKK
jgi:thioredoxin-related protein